MFFTDRASIEGAHRTGAGYLAADVRVARTGIQVYSGHEVGKPEMPTVRVWRPDKQVFAHGAMASAAHKPVTIGHPAQMVDSTNWKREAVGWTGDQVARDGEFLKIPMLLADQSAIDAVQNGTKEISCGYSSELHWGAGTTPTGEAYDAVQREISINHIAIVPKGRAGAECRFGDSADQTFLRDAAGLPAMLVDADTGAPIELNEDLIAAIVAEAARVGLSVYEYVKNVLRYQKAAVELGARELDPEAKEEK